MEPMPPNTAAVKALMPGMEPVVGMREVGRAEQHAGDRRASAEPMAKVMEMVLLTLMPMSWAAALSSDTARMALPILVLLVKKVSAAMMTRQTNRQKRDVEISLPSKSLNAPSTTGLYALGLEAQMSRAEFWRK